MLIPPPPPPSYTLAPDLPAPTAEQERALRRALAGLAGVVAGVVVADILSTDSVHMMELATARGTVVAVEPAEARGTEPRGLARYASGVDEGTLPDRLEMLLVLMWLDEGSPDDGAVALSVATAASELDAGSGREGLLAVMAALGELEERGAVEVVWPRGRGREARVSLADPLRLDAERLFGTG